MQQENSNGRQGVDNLLTAENIQDIEPGYYWYDDDTFSKDCIADKSVKAIVVLVQTGTIYGDIFYEGNCEADSGSSELYKLSASRQEKLCLLSLYQHQSMLASIEKINEALETTHQPLWNGRYLTNSDYACRQKWICCYPQGIQMASGFNPLKFRPVLYYHCE